MKSLPVLTAVRHYIQLPISERPKPRPVRDVSKMLNGLLLSEAPFSAVASPYAPSPSLHDRIHELLEPIKPYIFGETPMCKALNDAHTVFVKTNASPRVLFLLSDGISTDGDPLPIAQRLRDQLGVIIVTCFLTSEHIDNPRRLFDEADPDWDGGRSALFEMSSTMRNADALISYLGKTDGIPEWKLPLSGEIHLFVQANTLDVVNEFCEKVVSRMTEPR